MLKRNNYGLFAIFSTVSSYNNYPPADFSGIVSREPGESPWISRVLHKAVIEVNEKGSEAAAATVVEMMESAMPVEEIIEFVVNRPFFFVIADDRSGSIIFMGKVVEP